MCAAPDILLPSGNGDGLQYLCSKYSSLITQLKEEVLGKQRAESEARSLERRLHDEAALREVERLHCEQNCRALHEELSALHARQRQVDDLRETGVAELQHTAMANAQLNAQCERLQEARVEEAQRVTQAHDQVATGNNALLKQGGELMRLRYEHSELTAKHRDIHSEFTVCREHLSRWRRTATEQEGKMEAAVRSRDEAEGRARCLQEEMRQALRAASTARTREAAAALCAKRGEHELRSHEARLAAVRQEGRRYMRRAASAQRRLNVVEGCEINADKLAQENRELRIKLDRELFVNENIRANTTRADAGEARVAVSLGETRAELRAKDAVVETSRQHTTELEGELSRLRGRFEQLDGERAMCANTIEGLRQELQASREKNDEARRMTDRLVVELAESRRRADRGAPQLVDLRRRLDNAESTLAIAQAETAEERRARERCHMETIRNGEKLRLARSQGEHLRERVRALEEVEMRYPSRHRWDNISPESKMPLAIEPSAMTPPMPLTPPLLSSPQVSLTDIERLHPAGAGDALAVQEFVAREQQRLLTSLGVGAGVGDSSVSLERPRISAPAQTQLDTTGFSSAGIFTHTDASKATPDPDLSALLMAEPRVLKLPGPVQTPQVYMPLTTMGANLAGNGGA